MRSTPVGGWPPALGPGNPRRLITVAPRCRCICVVSRFLIYPRSLSVIRLARRRSKEPLLTYPWSPWTDRLAPLPLLSIQHVLTITCSSIGNNLLLYVHSRLFCYPMLFLYRFICVLDICCYSTQSIFSEHVDVALDVDTTRCKNTVEHHPLVSLLPMIF